MHSNRHLILFAHPRSGSSSLYQILQLHPALHILEEPFHEDFTLWNPNQSNYLERIHDIASLDAQLVEIFSGYNGIKVLNYQLSDALNVHLLQRPDCVIIFLRRYNLLQSVVSVLIAEQTTLWKKWEMKKPLGDYYRALQPLDVEEIQVRIRTLKAQLDFLEATVDARPDDSVIKVIYEGFYFAQPNVRNAQLAAIWQKLGLLPLNAANITDYLEPESAKINSNLTYDMLPNAQAIHEQCGNDETGWLYE